MSPLRVNTMYVELVLSTEFTLSNDKFKLMSLGYVREKSYPCIISFRASKVVGSSSFSAVSRTLERPANAAPTSCALFHLLAMLTSLRHAPIAVARK